METNVAVFTDFKASSEHALNEAIAYCKSNGANLNLIHVLQDFSVGSAPLISGVIDLQYKKAKRNLEALSFKIFSEKVNCQVYLLSNQNWHLKAKNDWLKKFNAVFIGTSNTELKKVGSFAKSVEDVINDNLVLVA